MCIRDSVLVAQVDLTKDLYEKADQEEKAIQEQLASYYLTTFFYHTNVFDKFFRCV